MRFKEWLINELISTLGDGPPTPQDQRDDFKQRSGCPELPMGVRSMCQPTTSAFPTYKKAMKKKSRR